MMNKVFMKMFPVCSQRRTIYDEKRCKLSWKTWYRRHIYFYKVLTCDSPPMMLRVVGVGSYPWDCLRGALDVVRCVVVCPVAIVQARIRVSFSPCKDATWKALSQCSQLHPHNLRNLEAPQGLKSDLQGCLVTGLPGFLSCGYEGSKMKLRTLL